MRMPAESLRAPDAPPTVTRVVLTGASGTLGRRVVAALRTDPEAVVSAVDLTDDRLDDLIVGADVVVHLDTVFGRNLDEDPAVERAVDVSRAQRLLDSCGRAGVTHLVVLSSATVYGAWPNNAVPLAETATLRPAPELAFAVQRAEIERRVAEWRVAHPGSTVTVLRPSPVVGDGPGEVRGDVAVDDPDLWLARALHTVRRVADIDGDAPAQFLHVDDLASAVVLAVRERLDGARNVAPDGWLRGAEYTALDAGTPKVRVPRRIGDGVARVRWALRLAPTPPGLVPYARHPWVVANDRLRADGWEPEHSNEESFVVGTPAAALATLSPRRRQEIALGITGAVLGVGVLAALVAAIRRLRR